MKRLTLASIVATLVFLGLAATLLLDHEAPTPPTATHQQHGPLHGLEAVFYKSPTCGCCHLYAEALATAGVRLEVVDDAAAMVEAKARFGVPPHAFSCHTFTLEGYVVEGHVPLEALEKLLAERPRVDGIALPGMPIGTPGMPGAKTAPYEVLSVVDGQLVPFMTL